MSRSPLLASVGGASLTAPGAPGHSPLTGETPSILPLTETSSSVTEVREEGWETFSSEEGDDEASITSDPPSFISLTDSDEGWETYSSEEGGEEEEAVKCDYLPLMETTDSEEGWETRSSEEGSDVSYSEEEVGSEEARSEEETGGGEARREEATLTEASAPILPPLNSSIPETGGTTDNEEDWETYSSEGSLYGCSRSCPNCNPATEEEEEVEEEGGWEDDLFCDAPPPLTRADIAALPTITLAREQVGPVSFTQVNLHWQFLHLTFLPLCSVRGWGAVSAWRSMWRVMR